ncbi:DUF2690 domain-containing protein [Kitasatospora sp. MAP5-34]|uniref:DUF2690 domain-containing protein n=1 Tax=Kitasatospora sp. MAP5-34 TaxID=3035102 RepID=UPI0024737F98|nr:DUF2690 domain-containing protein [Kitasatospora sp. MAP5-34]MDH6578749.1 hypothetical protein [Kitasatospora sp. MAP5-34]
MRTVRTAATLGAALLLAAAGVAAGPGLAAAVSRCTGAGCTGKDAAAAGCASGAVTKASFSGASVRVELRYSPSCHAAWAKATAAPAGQTLMVENGHGVRSRVTIGRGRATAWTPMVDGTTKVRACLGEADSDVLTCTNWF